MDNYAFKRAIGEIYPDWTDDAACHGKWELFDYDTPEFDTRAGQIQAMVERERKADEAVQICFTACPVRLSCLKDAIYRGTIETVRGGYKPPELAVLARDFSDLDLNQF